MNPKRKCELAIANYTDHLGNNPLSITGFTAQKQKVQTSVLKKGKPNDIMGRKTRKMSLKKTTLHHKNLTEILKGRSETRP